LRALPRAGRSPAARGRHRSERHLPGRRLHRARPLRRLNAKEVRMAELVLDARNGTGESPVWHAAEQALYWVDIPGRAIHRWSQAEGHRHWATEEMPACL